VECDPRCDEVGKFDAAKNDYVKDWKEYCKISLWSNPKLDVRHTFKRALNFETTCNKAYEPKKRQCGDLRGSHIADCNHKSGGDQESLVCEAELHSKKQREVYGHASKIGIKAHHNVFAHK